MTIKALRSLAASAVIFLAACGGGGGGGSSSGGGTPSTPVPTPIVTATPVPTPIVTATPTPTPTPTVTPFVGNELVIVVYPTTTGFDLEPCTHTAGSSGGLVDGGAVYYGPTYSNTNALLSGYVSTVGAFGLPPCSQGMQSNNGDSIVELLDGATGNGRIPVTSSPTAVWCDPIWTSVSNTFVAVRTRWVDGTTWKDRSALFNTQCGAAGSYGF